MSLKSVFSVIAFSALTLGFTACSDKDDVKDEPVTCDCATGKHCSNAEKATCAAANDSLVACDIQSAAANLDSLWNENKTSVDIAFQRSIVGMLNLLNHPKLQAVLPRLGFKSSDPSFLFQGNTSIFKAMVTKVDEDDDRFDNMHYAFDHKTFGKCEVTDPDTCMDIEEDGVIDANLTLGDLLQVFLDMEPEIASLTESLRVAADGMKDEAVARKLSVAGCNLGDIGFSASDLYTLAGMFDLARSGAHLASAYVLDQKLVDFVQAPDGHFYSYFENNDPEKINERLNSAIATGNENCLEFTRTWDNLLKDLIVVKDAAKAKPGFALLLSGVASLKTAANGKKASGSFFGWNALYNGIISDISKVADAVIQNNAGVAQFTIFTPPISVDISRIYNAPISIDSNHRLRSSCKTRAEVSKSVSYGSVESDPNIVDPKVLYDFLVSNEIKAVLKSGLFYQIEDNCLEFCGSDDACAARCDDYTSLDGYYSILDKDGYHEFFYYDDRYELSVLDSQDIDYNSEWEKIHLMDLLDPNEYFGGNDCGCD